MQHALEVGAYQHRAELQNFDGWRSMETAPRDGTVVEIKNSYGVAPWYDLMKWTDETVAMNQDGISEPYKTDYGWRSVKRLGHGLASESHSHWRPYQGDASGYEDPTGGLQWDMAYWRGAVAAKYGLPLNHFEEEVAARQPATRNTYPENPFPAAFAAVMLFVGLVAIAIVFTLK